MEAVALTLKQQENMSKPIIKMALMMLDNIRQQLIDGECDEEDIQCAMTKFHPEKNGYFKQEDFVTADKAMKILHLGNNRVKFFELTKKYGIENIKAPVEAEKEAIMNKDAKNFLESMKIKRELNAYLKKSSIYTSVTKPYRDAKNLIEQAENYTHYYELEQKYLQSVK